MSSLRQKGNRRHWSGTIDKFHVGALPAVVDGSILSKSNIPSLSDYFMSPFSFSLYHLHIAIRVR